MGIRFLCVNCDRKVHVKNFLAGKRGRCPHCDGKIRIPMQSTIPGSKEKKDDPEMYAPGSLEVPDVSFQSQNPDQQVAAPAAAPTAAGRSPAPPPTPAEESTNLLLEDPAASWYVAPPSGGQYGPADSSMMQSWITEGRISDDSLVWREGWTDWEPASKILGNSTNSPAPPTPGSAQHPTRPAGKSGNIPDAASVMRYKLSRDRSRVMGVVLIIGLAIVSIGLAILLFYVLQSNQ